MEHIKSIQEIVDEHKEALPTGAVQILMRETHALCTVWKQLYQVKMTTVDAIMENGEVVLQDQTSITIAKAVSHGSAAPELLAPVLRGNSEIHRSYLEKTMPFIHNSDGAPCRVTIVHSIEPITK